MSKLFIHHIDLDGISCYILAKQYKRELEITEFLPTDYKEFEGEDNTFDWKIFSDFDEIVYADITPSKKARDIIQEQNKPCLILDHHVGIKQEIDDWEYVNKIYKFDVEKSGALLVYEYLKECSIEVPKIIQEYAQIVSTYDLYDKKSQGWFKADSLNRLLWQTAKYYEESVYDKYSFLINTIQWKFDNQPNSPFTFSNLEEDKINASKKAENTVYQKFVTGKEIIKTRLDKEGRHFCIIKLTSKISAIASRLLERYKGLSYIIVINDYDEENPKVSIRSQDINMLDYEGTAGHEHACALKEVTKEWVNDLWAGKVFCLETRDEEESSLESFENF